MRKWVFKALNSVINEGTYSNLYLQKNLHQVEPSQRSAATRIFYGTLQNYGFCTYVWKQFAKKGTRPDIEVLMGMSVYQLLFMDSMPDYAVINEAVEIAKQRSPKMKGFVNAVLRKVKTTDIVYPKDELEKTAVETSLPVWVLKMWKAQYGFEKAVEFAKATLATLPVYVRIRGNSNDFKSPDFTKTDEPNLMIYNGNEVNQHPLYKEGRFSVQDSGSYQISQFVGVEKGMSVLDCCAAPGTKTMAMAEAMEDEGCIVAGDIHAHRVELIKEDAARLHIQCVQAKCLDARDLSDVGDFDRVLCDVPCSGYGVMARKPDIKLRLDPTDMDSLIPLQKEILESASKHVKMDGILVYSTCTLNKKENEKQVESFLQKHDDFICLDMKTIEATNQHNGFFMAKLKRIAV